MLPKGTTLTLVSDSTVDGRAQPGAKFRVHLKDAISIGGQPPILVAAAGTTAQLTILSRDLGPDGGIAYTIGLSRFKIDGDAGELPLTPVTALIAHISTGTEIQALTAGTVAAEGGRLRISIPLPFTLSNEPPRGGFTPIPLRTASPFQPRNPRRPSPTPTPTPSPTALPASPAPSPSASP